MPCDSSLSEHDGISISPKLCPHDKCSTRRCFFGVSSGAELWLDLSLCVEAEIMVSEVQVYVFQQCLTLGLTWIHVDGAVASKSKELGQRQLPTGVNAKIHVPMLHPNLYVQTF